MNAKLTAAEYELRDILVKALAGNADPSNARGVLSQALESLAVDIWAASTAYEAMGVGAGSSHFSALLLGISAKAEALEAFADRHLSVNFTTSADGES